MYLREAPSDHPFFVLARFLDPLRCSLPVAYLSLWSGVWAPILLWRLLSRNTRLSVALAIPTVFVPGLCYAFLLLTFQINWYPFDSRLNFWTQVTGAAFGIFIVFWFFTGVGLALWILNTFLARRKGRILTARPTKKLFAFCALLFLVMLPPTYYLGHYKTLEQAVREGDLALTQKRLRFNLMGLDANTGAIQTASSTPLLKSPLLPLAIENHDIEMVRLLLNNGAKVDTREYWNAISLPCPMRDAAREGDAAIVALLLDWGGDPKEAFLQAARDNNVEILRLLIERGGDVHVRDQSCNTLLDVAAVAKAEDAVRFLAPYGIELTNIHGLIRTDQFERVRMVVESGYDVNDCYWDEFDHYTPLLYRAVEFRCTEIVEYLMSKGAEPTAFSGDIRIPAQTPLHIAAEHGASEEVKILLRYGVDPDVQNQEQVTPLFIAASCPNVDVVRILVEAGADVNFTKEIVDPKQHVTPLVGAVRALNTESVRLLLEHGAIPQIDSKQPSLFGVLIAAYRSHYDLESSEKTTRILDIAHLLIKFGVDPLSTDGLHGRNAIKAAEEQQFTELAGYLRSRTETPKPAHGDAQTTQ